MEAPQTDAAPAVRGDNDWVDARTDVAWAAIARRVLTVSAGCCLVALVAWSAVLTKTADRVMPLASVRLEPLNDRAGVDQTEGTAAGTIEQVSLPPRRELVRPTTRPAAMAAGGTVTDNPWANDPDVRWFNGRPAKPDRTLKMRVTAYSPDHRSCGDSADGFTATMHSVETNGFKLVAADPKVLPYGSMVSPTGASMSRLAAQGTTPGDPEAAYASGRESGAAYWRGLLDENRRKIDEMNRTLGGVFDTREEAQEALRRFDDLSRARDELRDRYRRARQVERDAEKDAGRAIGTALAEGVANAADSIDKDFDTIAELFEDLVTDFDDQWTKWKPKKKDLDLDKRKGKRELDDLIDDIKKGFENKTFTTSLGANWNKAKGDLGSAISHVETKWTAPSVTWNTTIGANWEEVKIDISAAGGYAEANWSGGSYNTSLGGNDKAVRDAIAGLTGSGGWLRTNWFGTNFNTELGGNDSQVRNAVNGLTGAGGWLRTNWFGTNYNTSLGGDDNPVRTAVNNMTQAGGWLRTNWFGTSFTTNLAGNPQGVKDDVNGLIGSDGWLNKNWTGQTFRANMRMQDRSVNDIINDVQNSLSGAGFAFNNQRQLWSLRWRNDREGLAMGGTVQAMPAAALGRAVVVGEAGPEVAVLPYGTMVQPTGASRSRMAAEGRGTTLNVYGAVHVLAATPDIAREISRQLQSQGRA